MKKPKPKNENPLSMELEVKQFGNSRGSYFPKFNTYTLNLEVGDTLTVKIIPDSIKRKGQSKNKHQLCDQCTKVGGQECEGNRLTFSCFEENTNGKNDSLNDNLSDEHIAMVEAKKKMGEEEIIYDQPDGGYRP